MVKEREYCQHDSLHHQLTQRIVAKAKHKRSHISLSQGDVSSEGGNHVGTDYYRDKEVAEKSRSL